MKRNYIQFFTAKNLWLRLLPKWNTNKGTKRLITIERYQSFLFETSKYNYEENGINIYFPQNFTPAET